MILIEKLIKPTKENSNNQKALKQEDSKYKKCC